jgi:hypothetical protein
MNAPMSDHAVTPTLPEAATEPEFEPTGRERLGIAAFVVVAVVATATWVAALAWGAVQVVTHL